MVWTILGQDRISGKLESFILMKDGANPKQQAIDDASRTVEVIAIIQGNHVAATTLCTPYKYELRTYALTECQRKENEKFQRCSEYWEGI
tara:strand:- start:210 stop:479 length:270 start_codon:yes stop_codon:yes gene_type:complete